MRGTSAAGAIVFAFSELSKGIVAVYEYRCEIIDVHDADTMTVDADLGFSVHMRERLRLSGVNAPELRTDEGRAAHNWVAQWMNFNPGPYILRTSKPREREKYGRFLGRLESEKTGRVLNDDILAAGHAAVYKM